MAFDAKTVADEIVARIKEWFGENGKGCSAVVGLSGGIGGAVAATLCVKALGPSHVIGVMLPSGKKLDTTLECQICKELCIRQYEMNADIVRAAAASQLLVRVNPLYKEAKIDLLPRLRSVMLYTLAQSREGIVISTDTLSKRYIGYTVGRGNQTGDLAPFATLTEQEVKALGRYLELPSELLDRVPKDEWSGKTVEKILGFSYEVLDRYIREGVCDDPAVKRKIDKMHRENASDPRPTVVFDYSFTQE